jgi:hypothetical protein
VARQNILIVNKLIETAAWTFVDESVARLGAHTTHAKGVTTGDVNGDGWVDALFVNAFNLEPPGLYINQGAANPGFFNHESATRGLTTNYSSGSAQFGDLDDDGDLDLIVGDGYNGASNKPHLFFNNGTGVFAENAAALGAASKPGQMDVQLADVDNDWDLDFVGVNKSTAASGPQYLMLNNGAGTFSDVSTLISASSGNTYECEPGDLDNDNDLDLFFVSLSGFQEGPIPQQPDRPGLADLHQPGGHGRHRRRQRDRALRLRRGRRLRRPGGLAGDARVPLPQQRRLLVHGPEHADPGRERFDARLHRGRPQQRRQVRPDHGPGRIEHAPVGQQVLSQHGRDRHAAAGRRRPARAGQRAGAGPGRAARQDPRPGARRRP